MDAEAYLAESAGRVDALLERALPPATEAPAQLHAAMRHLLFPGGKRLRPALAFAAAEAVGVAPERVLPVAGAVELVHTYSLVHDDLPCMDDDEERRGRPTVHVAFDEATAVLAGDALQAAAFEALAAATDGPGAAVRLGVIAALARAVGSRQLVGGQHADLHWGSGPGDAAALEAVHRRKTAALIAFAVGGAARWAGAGDALADRLHGFGEAVGLAFQIADDLLDEERAEPCSMVGLLGAEAARARAHALLASALDTTGDLGERAEPLRELARFAVRRDR